MPAFYKNSVAQKLISWSLIFSIFISLAGVFLFPRSAMAIKAIGDAIGATGKTTAGAGLAAATVTCGGVTVAGSTVLGTGNVAAGITPCLAAIATAQSVDKAGEAAEKGGKATDSIVKELLQMAWNTFRKTLLDYMVDEIIKWIQGEGDPSFVTDWQGFMKNTAEQAGGKFLEEIVGTKMMVGLCQPDWAVKINLSLQKPKKFGTRARCTFKDIGENFDKFMDNFRNGGWKSWINVMESQNNPYGFYLMALDEKTTKEINAQTSAVKDAESGFGFLSDKVCVKRECFWITADGVYDDEGAGTETGKWKKSEAEPQSCISDPDEKCCDCIQWETRTPGKMMADAMNLSVSKDIDWLINNQELEAYVAEITDAILDRIIKEGVMALTSEDVKDPKPPPGSPSAGDFLDVVPPQTKAEPYDEWSIQITSNEPAGIYYTLDGTEPTAFSPLYNKPIAILSPLTLKWFGIDYIGNKEGTHSMDLNPPFTVPVGAPPSVVAVAIDSDSIALKSSKPATIYYTTDMTEPTTSSKRYIKKLDIGNPLSLPSELIPSLSIIKWLAVDSAGNQAAVKSATLWPPFPNNSEFPVISDLVTPIANISVPSAVSADTFFKLDSSGSADYDSTPKIVMYEWDFDNDGAYDWWTIDWNRDGVFDESQCRSGVNCGTGAGFLTGSGFEGMQVTSGALPGVIEVKYGAGISRTIGLRVTDDEGLYSTTNVAVDVK